MLIPTLLLASLAANAVSDSLSRMAGSFSGTLKVTAYLAEAVALYLVFRAFIDVGLSRPLDVYLESLRQNSELLQRQKDELERLNEGMRSEIAERRWAETSRLQAEQIHRSLLDNSAVGIVYALPDRTIRDANSRACAMFGYAPAEIQGMSIRLVHLSDRYFEEFVRQYARAAESAIASIDFPFRRKDGAIIWCTVFGTRLEEGDAEKGYVWTLLDITALREAQALARRLSRAVEQTSASVVMTDLQGNITFVNQSFCRTTGYDEREAIGKNSRILKSGAMPASVYGEMWASLAKGQPWRGELQNRRKNGELFWESAVIAPVTDDEGKITHYVAVKEDITERKMAEEALRRAKDDADAANRAKSEFLANMSHEIRTPMTAILGYADILADSVERPDEQEAVQTIKRNGQHLLYLINDILDLSKIEAGKFQIERISAQLATILGNVISLMRERAKAKGLPLKLEYVGPVPETIQTDPTRLRQIFVNLVSNAIKFTEAGEVKVRVRLIDRDSAEPKLKCEVVDTGLGMDAEQVARLFQPFQQADASTTRKFGGTGLGLAISKRLATLLAGDITVSSTPGVGSIFTVTIAIGSLENTAFLNQAIEGLAKVPVSFEREAATETRLKCRILLAEDGPDNQRLIAFVLRKAGADVEVVDNGQKAIEKGLASLPHWGQRYSDSEQPFDLILMDMQMPVLDGYEATRQLRQHGYTGPILALTAHAMKDDMRKCLDAGCDAYLTKPIVREQFLSTVAGYLDHATASSEVVSNVGNKTPRNPLPRMPVNSLIHGDPMMQPLNTSYVYSTLASEPDLDDLVELFVQEMPDRITALETQARNRDWRQITRTAHQLKGAAGSYGFGAITPYAARLENAARNGGPEDEILSALNELLNLCRHVRPGVPPAQDVNGSNEGSEIAQQ